VWDIILGLRPQGENKMRLTIRQLKRIIKEEKAGVLKEYEVYVDEDGNTYDDEGNVEKKGSSFGRRYGGDTYTGTDQPWMSGRKKAVPPMSGSARGKQLAAVEMYLASQPNKFLQSLADQMNAGKRMSSKQMAIMKKILVKADPANEELFESKMKITKRQLVRIIREEAAEMTKKYDDNPELKGDQDELPDHLQKGIIDKAEEDDIKEVRLTKKQLIAVIKEELSQPMAVDKRDELMGALKQRYGMEPRTTEEFGTSPGGVWINAESNVPETEDGLPLFDYHLQVDPYIFGIHPDFEAFVIDRYGFAPEWNDPGTLMLWRL
jgi:hypothetical protein